VISGTPGFVGVRLKQAREAMGLTVTSLGQALGVTKQAVSRWEGGLDSPRPELFDRLCGILCQPAYFFMQPIDSSLLRGTRFYRSLASTTSAARQKADARNFWARETANYVLRYVEFPRVNFPVWKIANPSALTMRDVEVWASETRRFWGLGDAPIANLLRVAENNGALVVRDYLDAETLDALSEWLEPEGIPFIVLNADKESAVRSRLDLAHELGHLILHRKVSQEELNKKALFKQIEKQAFRFGGALLLPERAFLADLYSLSLDALRALKSKWKVAIAAMIYRLADLGVLTEDQEKRFWINYARRGWKQREPLDDQLPFETPSVLPQAFQIIVDQGHDRDQIPGSIGHGKSQIEQIANLPENFLGPSPSVQAKIIPFRKLV